MIGRRNVLTLLGGAAAGIPLAARAQQPAMPVIGYLDAGSAEPNAPLLSAFRKGLSETGYAEGRNVAIEFRWAEGRSERLPELAADLVRRRVALIVTGDGTQAALAAKAATATIPIVFMTGVDPVETGLVASLNRPGGNATGITHMNALLEPKRLALLHELVPRAARFAALVPNTPLTGSTIVTDLQAAASVIGGRIEVLAATTRGEIDAAFASLEQKRADALMVSAGTLIDRRVQILTLATRYGLPTIYPWRADAVAGGLMSYGIVITDQFRQMGIYTGRLLKGEKPADLPVMRPTRFEFVINLQTARALGIEVPPSLLSIADEVIE
jgi:putative tryptophan/tyrosine transport system substrate-binding protein